jgi:hypothetical protein
MILNRSDLLHSLGCSLICMAALLLAWPFANLSFNDDWTWAFTVLQLSKTGHLLYNGWSSPPVIAQAYWGLMWVKLFGFSLTVLRVSTLPMAAGAVSLCYLLARRAGLTASMSVFVSLSLGLSPLFMPLASTFMTDVPGLFFMLLSLYALVLSFETKSRASCLGWLMAGVVAALIGGSSRQVVWIVPLVVLPYFSWIRRSDLSFVVASISGWVILLAGAIAMQHWFGKQPYALPDPPALSYLHAAMAQPKRVALGVICVILTMVMMMLPAVVGVLRQKPGVREMLAVLLCIVAWLVLRHHSRALEPWMGNIFSNTGVLSSIEVGGGRPELLSDGGRLVLSVIVIAGLWFLFASAGDWCWRNRQSAADQVARFFFKSTDDQTVVAALVLLGLAIFALEITRCISGVAYDRHLLPLIPFIVIPLLCALQRGGRSRMPAECWISLAIFTAFAVASTQEVNSLARARVAAIGRLENSGIASTQIDGGFEHDYWTELQADGHINDARLRNPPGAYDRTKGPTPAMRTLYRLESNQTAVTASTPFGSVSYFSLLPPFHRTVCIDRFKDTWWLDPVRAATRPADTKQLLPKVLLDQYKQ